MLLKHKAVLLICSSMLVYLSTLSDEDQVPHAPETSIVKFPLPNPSDIGAERFSLLLNTFLKQGGYEKWIKDLRPRTTGRFQVYPSGIVESFGIHGTAAVQVCYSPQVLEWMQRGRKGLIPDGGMIIKLLYERNLENPTRFSEAPTGYSIMVKDSKGSWDGWFYTDGELLQKPTHEHAATFFDPNAGFSISCMNCHASADNPESTFSSIRNTTGVPSFQHPTIVSPEGLKNGLKYPNDIHSIYETKPAGERKRKDPAPYWDYSETNAVFNEPRAFPLSAMDHVPQGPRPDGQRPFITASNCAACHDAVQLNTALPNMALRTETKLGAGLVNLSPSSEWRHSMMSLSGRDPVFFAQLESERALHPELADQIDNKCLSCHAAMGQRQWIKDHGADSMFTHKMAKSEPGSPFEKYGALSRDGVSCIVCHQMEPKGMGEPQTYSGKFKLIDKPTQVFGPYEKVATLSMEQALGLTPKHGAHISDSKLCASCHTITLPVLHVGRKYTPNEFEQLAKEQEAPKVFHEQTTYLEWKNSSFSTEGSAPGPKKKSCQDCHMSRTYQGNRLRFRIANIEDDTFPAVDNRATDKQLHVELRDTYSRHDLNGINLFMLEMFSQNPEVLGIPLKNNLCPTPDALSGFDVAKEAALEMAQSQSAAIKIVSAKREPNRLIARVQVSNLTGHKFPTGVPFRRAFVEFKVQVGNKTIWISGMTDKWGVIGNRNKEKFSPLKSEFFTDGTYQPHHETITREDQVQIYEKLVADSEGALTTSFFSLKTTIKDNRLLPQGWSAASPDAEVLHPEGATKDKDYQNGEGRDIITYEIPVSVAANEPLSISATLYYQALPPYYLKQRFAHVDKPDTQRLYYLVNQLDLENTDVRDWKLKISQDKNLLE